MCKQGFKELRRQLTKALVLALLEPNKQFVVCSGATKYGLGFILMQRGKVVSHVSRQLKDYLSSTVWNWK